MALAVEGMLSKIAFTSRHDHSLTDYILFWITYNQIWSSIVKTALTNARTILTASNLRANWIAMHKVDNDFRRKNGFFQIVARCGASLRDSSEIPGGAVTVGG